MSENETVLKDALVVVTGARNSGKTLFAITTARPSQIDRMFYHDSERSSNRAIQEIEAQGLSPGYYGNLEARFSGLPAEDDLLSRIRKGRLPWVTEAERDSLESYYLYVLKDLDENLKRGKYLFYIHDTIEKLEAGMAAWVEGHKKQAGWKGKAFGGMWKSGVYPLYEQLLEAIFQRGVKTIVFCSHLKQPWEGNRPVVGKVVPSGKTLLWFRTSLFLWLTQNPNNVDGAPAGLVLKERLASLKVAEEDEWIPRRMLPRRIPHCTWKDIRRYLKEGCDLVNPAPGETLSQEEKEMTSEFLTSAQMRLMQLEVQKEVLELQSQMPEILRVSGEGEGKKFVSPSKTDEERAGSALSEEQTQKNEAVAKALAGGMSPPVVARELDLPLPLVLRIKRDMEVK